MDFDYKPKLTLSPDDDAPQAPEMKAVSEAEIRPVEQIHEHTMEKLSEAGARRFCRLTCPTQIRLCSTAPPPRRI